MADRLKTQNGLMMLGGAAIGLLLIALVSLWAMHRTSDGTYMVAAANPYASDAGAEILKQGGSAVDAAIAVQAVLGLVEPESSGMAGGAFMLHWDRDAEKLDAYDGRETAPAGATPDMFLDASGQPMDYIHAIVSGRSVGAPGVVKMLWLAHQAHGKLAWDKLFEPAIKLASDGFAVSPKLAAAIARDPALAHIPVTQDYFFTRDVNGAFVPLAAGAILKNPAYAQTLREVAAKGTDGFYKGPVAQAIVDAVAQAPNLPGTLSLADLDAYEAKDREPLCGPYRDVKICTMPPPTSGGVTSLQILGILEHFDMGDIKPMSLEAVHFIAEAEKLAYADRDKYIGDPDRVKVPVAAMLDAAYLKSRAQLIDASLSMGKASPGSLPQKQGANYGRNGDISRPSTSHFVIDDGEGNVVSMTTSVEAPFGSHLMAAGMILNNQLTDFSFVPVDNGKPVANAVAPGKRPRSSMDPTIIFDADGHFKAAIGSPGGSRIIGYVTQSIIALIDWKMPMQEALNLPRFLDRNGDLEIEEGTDLEALVPQLKQLGHGVKVTAMNSGLHGLEVTADGLRGGADPRREGKVVTGIR